MSVNFIFSNILLKLNRKETAEIYLIQNVKGKLRKLSTHSTYRTTYENCESLCVKYLTRFCDWMAKRGGVCAFAMGWGNIEYGYKWLEVIRCHYRIGIQYIDKDHKLFIVCGFRRIRLVAVCSINISVSVTILNHETAHRHCNESGLCNFC